MKMEPTMSSETSAIRTQTPGNYSKRNKLHLEHGDSLKTRRKNYILKKKNKKNKKEKKIQTKYSPNAKE